MIHVVSMSGTYEWIQVQKSMISTMNEIDIDEFDYHQQMVIFEQNI